MEREIKFIVIDVDGTMTDGGIYYDEFGKEIKKFCTRDAAGFFAAKQVGIKIIVLTGRESHSTEKRMNELGVDYLYQNIKNKQEFLRSFMEKNGIKKYEIGYIGDDLNDLSPMKLVGYIGCPQDACREIKEIADYISPIKAGSGAVRDVIECLLRKTDEWNSAVSNVYGIGI